MKVLGTYCSNTSRSCRSLSCDHSGNRFLRKTNELLCMCVCVCVCVCVWGGGGGRASERACVIVLPLSLPLVSSASLIAAAPHIHAQHSVQPIHLFLARKWLTGSTVCGLHLLCQHHPHLDHHVCLIPLPIPLPLHSVRHLSPIFH